MADRGTYLVVVRNDMPLPDVVHNSIRPDTEVALADAREHAHDLHESSKGRIPFTVARIVHEPLTVAPWPEEWEPVEQQRPQPASERVAAAYEATRERLKDDPETQALVAAAEAEQREDPTSWSARNRLALHIDIHTTEIP